MNKRTAEDKRTTKETSVKVVLNVDGRGRTDISTGVGFADHMLTLMAFWAGFDLELACEGDLEVDAHHSLEDVGLTLGKVLADALGDKLGVARVAQAKVPMDDSLAEAVVDLSGRPYLVYVDAPVPSLVAGLEKDLFREFFKSLAFAGKFNLHLRILYGESGHHMLEAAFKALGLALKAAVRVDREGVSSTKGSLDV